MASVLDDTVGNVTVKLLEPEPLPLMVQVCAVIVPLNVIVPSAAAANCDAMAVLARITAEISLVFIGNRFKKWIEK